MDLPNHFICIEKRYMTPVSSVNMLVVEAFLCCFFRKSSCELCSSPLQQNRGVIC